MKNFVLILALMLAACASDTRWDIRRERLQHQKNPARARKNCRPLRQVATTGAKRSADAAPQKREHNIEED